ncbi:questin oxidase family protein [Nonomuraea rubra]|uniref:questin oxidase family protein n=1 Tax=Nonomuraea rubra TaxID=46180 RepID=UPI00360B1A1F
MNDTGTLEEAYGRLHRTGPEFDGWLSNHGPMAVEAMVRHGYDRDVHRWLDGYVARLDELPRGTSPLDAGDWRAALGDPRRLGDWLAFFDRELRERPWRAVLERWWPRLLPGIAAGATHGVIRTGHAVHALLQLQDATRLAELGQALGYWAARWQPIAAFDAPSGTAGPKRAFAGCRACPTRARASTTGSGSLPRSPGGPRPWPRSGPPPIPSKPSPGSPSWRTRRPCATSPTPTATPSCWSTPRPRRRRCCGPCPRCRRTSGSPA